MQHGSSAQQRGTHILRTPPFSCLGASCDPVGSELRSVTAAPQTRRSATARAHGVTLGVARMQWAKPHPGVGSGMLQVSRTATGVGLEVASAVAKVEGAERIRQEEEDEGHESEVIHATYVGKINLPILGKVG